RTHAVKNIFRIGSFWDRAHNYVRARQYIADRPRYRFHNLLRALECNVARKADGKVGKVSVASTPDSYAVNFQQPFNPGNSGNDLIADARRRGIQKRVNRPPRQPPA